jgi:hypothetical protein
MRRLFGWMAGLAGIAALARLLSARQTRHEPRSPVGGPPDPADALRQKLSATRAEPTASAAAADAAVPVDASPAETFDERRARIHAKAQEAIESMQGLEPPA